MIRDTKGVPILDKLRISTREVVIYLESINVANKQILSVLRKRPALPDIDKLTWFIEYREEKKMARKLKNNKKLSENEREKLKRILTEAKINLKKLTGVQGIGGNTEGLEDYIRSLTQGQ